MHHMIQLIMASVAEETHGASGGEEAQELPNILTFVHHFLVGTTVGEFLHKWENVLFSLLIIVVLVIIARKVSRNMKMISTMTPIRGIKAIRSHQPVPISIMQPSHCNSD